MDVTFYGQLDPRRLLHSSFKNLADLAPVLSQSGEHINLIAQTEIAYDGNLEISRDITFTGKIKASMILHGNCNVTFQNAVITNTPNARVTIALAEDFSGTLTIINSQIKYIDSNIQGYAIFTNSGSSRPEQLQIANSTIDGIAIMPSKTIIQGNVTILSKSKQAWSIINTTDFDGNGGHLFADNLVLIYSSVEPARLHALECIAGPVELNGNWQIDEMIVNANNKSTELFKINGRNQSNLDTSLVLTRLSIKKAPKGLSLFYADNSKLTFNNATLGDDKNTNKVAVRDCIINMKQSTDHLIWQPEGENVLNLDANSITPLRKQKDKFVNLEQLHQKALAQKQKADDLNNKVVEKETQEASNTMPKNIPSADNTKIKANDNMHNEMQKADALSELNELIGLKPVKKQLMTYVRLAQLNKEREKRGLQQVTGLSRNMVFGGDPGTGKTTVARLVARLLHERGALPTDHYVECTTKDLIGNVVGATTQNTHKKVEEAIGGVLFIDEAYMLGSKGNSFAPEAVAQLLKDMEDNRSNLIVILAGYTAEMHNFINHANEGLKSRFNNWIEFPDYTESEKLQIFQLLCKKKGLICDPSYLNTKVFKWNMQFYSRDHANARSVRNYVEALARAQSNRLGTLDLSSLSNKELQTITAADINTVNKQAIEQYKTEQAQKKQEKLDKQAGKVYNSMGTNNE